MDWNALVSKMNDIEPSNIRSIDISQLKPPKQNIDEPAKDFVKESVDVPKGSLSAYAPSDINEFAKLAGISTSRKTVVNEASIGDLLAAKRKEQTSSSVGQQAQEFLSASDNIRDMVMSRLNAIKTNADPELHQVAIEKFNDFLQAYEALGNEISQPDLFSTEQQPAPAPTSSDDRQERNLARTKNTWFNKLQKKVDTTAAYAQHAPMRESKSLSEYLQKAYEDFEMKEKIKGADGKACWPGKRYAGTKNGKDICIPVKGKK